MLKAPADQIRKAAARRQMLVLSFIGQNPKEIEDTAPQQKNRLWSARPLPSSHWECFPTLPITSELMNTDDLGSTELMSPRPTDTLDLVRDAQEGDREALEQLFARYYPRVLKIVRLRLGAKLRQRVESIDVVQDVFTTAVRIFPRFEMRSEGSLVHWLSKLAENTLRGMFDQIYAQKNDPTREQPIAGKDASGETVWNEPMAELAIPLDQAIRDEESELVDSCLETMPSAYRELILLRNCAGLSFREIAAMTSRPSEGAARMMHAKAMLDLTALVARRAKR